MGGRAISRAEIAEMDPRIQEALKGWMVKEQYKGREVTIPGDWDSSIYPYRYMEVYKQDGDVNPGEEENEIQCYVSCGWEGMDDEVIIHFLILGQEAIDSGPVAVEIYKTTAAPIKVYRYGQLVTDFKEKFWKIFSRRVHRVGFADVDKLGR